jgi:hypothetical protein
MWFCEVFHSVQGSSLPTHNLPLYHKWLYSLISVWMYVLLCYDSTSRVNVLQCIVSSISKSHPKHFLTTICRVSFCTF